MYRCVSREQIEQYLYRPVHNLMIGVIEEEAPEYLVDRVSILIRGDISRALEKFRMDQV